MTNVNDRHYVASYSEEELDGPIRDRAKDFATDLQKLYNHVAGDALPVLQTTVLDVV